MAQVGVHGICIISSYLHFICALIRSLIIVTY